MAEPVDAKLIARLLQQHTDALQRYAAQWTVCPEDCVQEAFVKLAGQTPLPNSIAAWLYRVVRNDAINRGKSERRRSEHEQFAAQRLAAEKDSFAQRSVELGGQEELEAALKELVAADRELIVLRIWSQLTWQEIATLTDQSSSGAQRHYVAALEKLKRKLEQSCPTNPSPTISNYRQN